MRSFELIAASMFLAAGAWVANAGGTTGIEIDDMTTGAISGPVESYVMRSGSGASCNVEKGKAIASGIATVTIHGGCEALLPAVSRIKFWRDRADGSVEFVGAGAETVIVFGVGDGVDFESFRPVTPLISLASRG